MELLVEGLIKFCFLGLKKIFGEKIWKMLVEFIRFGEEFGFGVDFWKIEWFDKILWNYWIVVLYYIFF